jgi:hypothetical protein
MAFSVTLSDLQPGRAPVIEASKPPDHPGVASPVRLVRVKLPARAPIAASATARSDETGVSPRMLVMDDDEGRQIGW